MPRASNKFKNIKWIQPLCIPLCFLYNSLALFSLYLSPWAKTPRNCSAATNFGFFPNWGPNKISMKFQFLLQDKASLIGFPNDDLRIQSARDKPRKQLGPFQRGCAWHDWGVLSRNLNTPQIPLPFPTVYRCMDPIASQIAKNVGSFFYFSPLRSTFQKKKTSDLQSIIPPI